jgi:1-acyl-sn-glycerol-3-phosphate acyltransferase
VRTAFAAIHTAVALTVVALYTIVAGSVAVAVAAFRPTAPFIDRAVIHSWARVFLAVTGVKLEVVGQHLIDPGTSYVFVSNHLSDIDIPAHFLACRNPIRFLAKKELFSVPFLGFFMKRLGFIRVDRQAGSGSHRAVNQQVGTALDLGRSLIIYPEGTRSRSAEMAPFKKGAFRIAFDNDMPVLPMAISRSAYDIWPPGSKIIRRGNIRVAVGAPMSPAEFGGIEELRDEAEATVRKLLEEANQS